MKVNGKLYLHLNKKMIKVVVISIAIAALGFFPLMGLPGVWVLMLSKPGVYLIYGPMAFDAF